MSTGLVERPVWSRSQVATLRECRRKFALHHKAARGANTDPIFARAAALKKLKNRHLWTGSFVHESIGNLLKTLRQGNPPPSSDTVISDMKMKMREDFKSSRSGSGGAERLFEHEHGIALPPEVWQGHWNTVEASLRWFLQSKWLERLGALGPECWKAVDELLEFDVNNIKAFVKIDCAVETDGRFVLIDWKTSAPNSATEPSLLVSALYAHDVWGAETDGIDAVAVSLLDGKTFHANVTEEALMDTQLRIEEEAALLQKALIRTSADPFAQPLPESVEVCRRCNFQKMCHPGGIS